MDSIKRSSRPTTDLRFNIESPEGEREELALQGAKDIASEYRAFLAEQQVRKNALSTLRDQARNAIADMVGRSKWEGILEYSRHKRATNYGIPLQLPATNPHELVESVRREARRESFQLLRDSGIDQEELRQLQREWFQQIAKAVEPKRTVEPAVRLVPEAEVPTEILQRKTNPWIIKEPPFSHWYWYYDWQIWDGGDLDFDHNVLKSNGQIGHWSTYKNYDAGDFDMLFLYINTSVAFWHKPSSGGNTEIWVKLRADHSGYYVLLTDEWGWSSSDTHMWASVAVDVVGVPASKSQVPLWEIHIKGSPDYKHYIEGVSNYPDVIWANFKTSLPPNSWSLLRISTVDERHTGLNDVGTLQDMNNKWRVEEIHIKD
jgi:hypothetical protein